MSEHRKKILFLITKANFGGAQRYVFDLATALKEQFDVAVAVGGDGTLTELLEREGIRVISIPELQRDMSLTKEIASFLTVSRIIRSERPDILHVNSSKAGGIGAFLGRLHRVPRIIFTAHAWAFNEDRSVIQRYIVGFFHFLTIILAHRTIAVSEGLKREMNWPWTQRRMVVIHPGRKVTELLDKVTARNEIIKHTSALQSHGSEIWIGTIAELHPIKRLDVAITAMSSVIQRYPEVRYVIIGSGEQRAKLEAQVRGQNLEAHVFFAGLIPEAARMLRALDLFILPSHSESFGYVLLEAGHAHLPVVATKVGGIPDIITPEENGTLIAPDDSDALTNAVLRYLDNPTLSRAHAEKLHARVANFSLERMTEDTVKLYLNS